MQRVSLRAARLLPFASQILAVATAAAGTAIVACSSDDASTTARIPTVTIISGSAQQVTVGAPAPAPLVVKVVDQSGVAISGYSVTFMGSAGATLDTTNAITDSSGLAHVNLTMGTKSGADTVTAIVAGGAQTALFLETAIPGAPSAVAVVAGNAQTSTAGSALPVPLVVEVTDQFGNPVPNVPVDWSGAGNIAAAQTVTDATGEATDTVVLPSTSGTDTITAAVDGGGAATPAKFTETVQ